MMHFRSTLALSALTSLTALAQQIAVPPHQEFMFGEAKIMAESGFDGKVVKGAPYSAQAVTETTQVLANGTRINRKSSASIARDSEGRTRREETLSSVGPWSTDGQVHTMVFLNDPVAQANYVLDPARHSANKMPARQGMLRRTGSGADTAVAEAAGVKIRTEISSMETRHQHELANLKTESLGTQTIAGVAAVGTRRTRAIPVGQIGNDQPINIVSETWYSQELQIVVMSKHSDPRNGDTVYTLTNLQRSEPDASLFTVPADFTFQDNSQKHVLLRNKTDQ